MITYELTAETKKEWMNAESQLKLKVWQVMFASLILPKQVQENKNHK